MGSKTVKVEFNDDSGSKYSLKISGDLSREKIMKLMDIYELMNIKQQNLKTLTTYDKLKSLIQDEFNLKIFDSKDILTAYEDKYKKSIELSIISTYLRRLSDDNYITRYKQGRNWIYSLQTLKQKIPLSISKRTNYKKPIYK
ncbi:MAG: hypothetical protein JRN19_00900 [Nitrososphaerota archaeon]|nr:hypothetical protein [Nitrososphaerota archaeon]MDG7051004.1 hypothetical protein [Nitrososphaerota archaeon]